MGIRRRGAARRRRAHLIDVTKTARLILRLPGSVSMVVAVTKRERQ
jgi:hypothetical protein